MRNTEPPWYEAAPTSAPALHLPAGSTNLAAGKPVTGSDLTVIGDLKQLTDGDNRGNAECLVELLPGKQYVQIDLLTNAAIQAVWLWHYYSWVPNSDVPNDVIVQLGSDSAFTGLVKTVFNCDKDGRLGLGRGNDRPFGTSKFGKLLYVNAVRARFVRIYGRGGQHDDLTRFVEIEVYGVPISDKESAERELKATERSAP